MLDETDFDPDLFALQIGETFSSGLSNNDVIAVGIISQHDHDATSASATHHESVAVGDSNGVKFACRKGIHGCRIVKPLELNIDACLLKPALIDGDLPSDPSWPIAISYLQWLRGDCRMPQK
jgi:hypothetical protein